MRWGVEIFGSEMRFERDSLDVDRMGEVLVGWVWGSKYRDDER